MSEFIHKKFIQVRAINRRISVFWVQLKDKNENRIIVVTKRLIDRKTRNIHTTEIHYSIESIHYLRDALNVILDDPEFIKENKDVIKVMFQKMASARTDCQKK